MDSDHEKAHPDPKVIEVDEFTPREQKKIIRQVDRRVTAVVGLLYCISIVDRTNLGAANIAGLSQDLVLGIDNRYSVATLVFFITYILFQPPSTIIIRKLGPRIHLSLITFAWGILLIGIGFNKSFGGLVGLRIVLGLFEAGFFPSAVYLLSTWYTRFEVGKRYSLFYILGSLASAFSGILAYGLTKLEGKGGIRGWSWIFIIEGIFTSFLALWGYFLLVDFPDSDRKTWSFLGPRERAWIVRRVNEDRGDADVPNFELGKFLRGGKDWRVWGYGLIGLGTSTINYGFAYFLPIILNKNLGFDIGTSQILTAPPYVLSAIYMHIVNWAGDKYRIRGPIIIINMIFCLIGLPILGFHSNNYVRYFGVFLICSGANANVPSALAYQANNIRGQWKRAFTSAVFVGSAGVGGIAGSLVFRAQDAADGYKPGIYACIVACVLVILVVIANNTSFYLMNKAADRGEKMLEGEEDGGVASFRYTL